VKTARVAHLIPIALLALATFGCASAPSKFYTLESTAAADRDAVAGYAILVAPVTVPASVDRPELVVQDAPNRVSIDEFNRWASPLADSIATTVAGDLVKLLGTPRVAASPLANFDADYRVSIEVQRFHSTPGQSVEVDAVWVVRRAAGGAVRSGRTVASEPIQGTDYSGIAAAHSRALAHLSGDVAGAVRALATHG
jgi:uncharacterized lipoprotein YmbA